MPAYTRKCNQCDEIFTVHCKISEKDSYNGECPFCGGHDQEWMLDAPMFNSRSDRLGQTTKGGFNEVLAKIAERNPRTPVTERL